RRIGGVKQGEELVANQTRVKLAKSKVSRPFAQAEFQIKYGQGIDVVQDLLNICVGNGTVAKSGSWYSYGEQRLGQGEIKVVEFLRENPKLIDELYQKVGI
ncbi:MAG: recombinase RecA, partial [Candidatus Thorarchaeota archaeon]